MFVNACMCAEIANKSLPLYFQVQKKVQDGLKVKIQMKVH